MLVLVYSGIIAASIGECGLVNDAGIKLGAVEQNLQASNWPRMSSSS